MIKLSTNAATRFLWRATLRRGRRPARDATECVPPYDPSNDELRRIFRFALLVAIAWPVIGWSADEKQDYPFANDIAAFEAQDAKNPPPTGAVLFTGSSSIVMWSSLAKDFPDTTLIKRGFGGSQMEHLVHYADRIVIPYKPRLVFVYEGDNDIASGKSPEQVAAGFKELVAKVHAALPKTRIAYISTKPSPSRWHLVEKVQKANALIKEFIATDKRLTYIDVFTPMLGGDGKPRAELFIGDNLHMNATGYKLWQSIIEPVLKFNSAVVE